MDCDTYQSIVWIRKWIRIMDCDTYQSIVWIRKWIRIMDCDTYKSIVWIQETDPICLDCNFGYRLWIIVVALHTNLIVWIEFWTRIQT